MSKGQLHQTYIPKVENLVGAEIDSLHPGVGGSKPYTFLKPSDQAFP